MIITILLGLIGIWFLGFLMAGLFTGNFIQKLGLGYLLGFPIFTLCIHVLVITGNTVDTLLGWKVMGLLILILTVINIRNKNGFKFTWITVSKDKLVLGVITALSFFIFSGALKNFTHPVSDWDAITVYDLRAKILVIEGDYKSIENMSHPMYTSLAHWWLYSIGLPTPMIFYSLIFGSFIVTSWGILKSKYSDKITALLTLTLALSPGLFKYSTIAYLNMPYTIYFTLAVAYLVTWTKQKDSKLLILCLLLTGFSVWTRSTEPFWPLIPAIIIWTKLTSKYLKLLMIIVSIIAGSVAINKYHFDFFVGLNALNFIKLAVVEYYIGYFAIALLLFIEDWKNNRRFNIYSIIVIGCLLILWFGTTVLLGQNQVWVLMPDTLHRIGMLFPLLITFWFIDIISFPLFPPSTSARPKSSGSSPGQP